MVGEEYKLRFQSAMLWNHTVNKFKGKRFLLEDQCIFSSQIRTMASSSWLEYEIVKPETRSRTLQQALAENTFSLQSLASQHSLALEPLQKMLISRSTRNLPLHSFTISSREWPLMSAGFSFSHSHRAQTYTAANTAASSSRKRAAISSARNIDHFTR